MNIDNIEYVVVEFIKFKYNKVIGASISKYDDIYDCCIIYDGFTAHLIRKDYSILYDGIVIDIIHLIRYKNVLDILR